VEYNKITYFFQSFRSRSKLVCFLLLLSAISFNPTVLAQTNKDDEQEVFDDKRGDVAIDQETLDKAENAFLEGLTAYRAKKFTQAATLFKSAHTLVPYRDLLFNIARAYEALNDNNQAVKYYQLYLKTKPIDETQIIHRMRQLGVSQFKDSSQGSSDKKDTKDRSPSSSSSEVDILSWSVLGSGIALVGLGSYFGISALDSAKSAREAKATSLYNQSKDNAESEALIADVSLTLGIATIAGGIYLLMTTPDKISRMRTNVEPPKSQSSLSDRQSPKSSLAWQVIYTEKVQGLSLSGSF
jgi:tetratricopeptide (TPR) repeat protein